MTKHTQEQIDLAESLGVSIHDLMMFVNSMVNSIEQDKMAEHFINGSDDFQSELVKAYAPVVVKKFNQFLITYMTVPEAKFNFELSVYTQLKSLC